MPPTGVTTRSWSARRIFACMAGVHVADLIEKQRSALGFSKGPVRSLWRREGALHMAEQLAFHELGRDGSAVDGDERACAAMPWSWMARATSSLPFRSRP